MLSSRARLSPAADDPFHESLLFETVGYCPHGCAVLAYGMCKAGLVYSLAMPQRVERGELYRCDVVTCVPHSLKKQLRGYLVQAPDQMTRHPEAYSHDAPPNLRRSL